MDRRLETDGGEDTGLTYEEQAALEERRHQREYETPMDTPAKALADLEPVDGGDEPISREVWTVSDSSKISTLTWSLID